MRLAILVVLRRRCERPGKGFPQGVVGDPPSTTGVSREARRGQDGKLQVCEFCRWGRAWVDPKMLPRRSGNGVGNVAGSAQALRLAGEGLWDRMGIVPAGCCGGPTTHYRRELWLDAGRAEQESAGP